MGIQVGRWDCKYCGHKGNLGPETKCAECGAPRAKDVKFYLPEDAEYLTDEAAIQAAEAGPDWHCDHCGADNKAGSTKCRQCGNDRTEEDEARQTRDYGLEEVPHSDEDTRPKKDKTPPPPPPAKSRKGLYGCLAVIGLRRRNIRLERAPFRLPGGAAIPWVASAAIVALLSTITFSEFRAIGSALAVAIALYPIRAWRMRSAA